MAKSKPKIKLMVASTVYQNKDLLLQICGLLAGYGYHVINSEYGTLHPTLGQNNVDACLAAVDECDIFFGIINPFYSTGITHLEFKRAIASNKPRRFIAHSFVPFTRKLLEPMMFIGNPKVRTDFTIQRTTVMDNIQVIDMYNDAIQDGILYSERRYHWVQEFFRPDEAFRHVETLFADIYRIKEELKQVK